MRNGRWTPIAIDDPNDSSITYQPKGREHVMMAVSALGRVATDAARMTARGVRLAHRWLATPRPTWQPLALATLAAAAALWLHGGRPTTQEYLQVGPTHVQAAGNDPAIPYSSAPPELQPGYVDPRAPELEAPPPALPEPPLGSHEPPSFLTPGLHPHWPDILASALEHGVDPWVWGAVIVVECPLGVESRPFASCQYTNGSDAGGLAQVTGGTAEMIAAASGYPCVTQRLDPVTSLRCGAYHFRDLLRAAGSYWSPDNEEPAILLASIAYNAGPGSTAYTGARALAAGGGDVCAGIPAGFDAQTHRYCREMRGMWVTTLSERGPASPYIRPVAPGGPDHLEANSTQP